MDESPDWTAPHEGALKDLNSTGRLYGGEIDTHSASETSILDPPPTFPHLRGSSSDPDEDIAAPDVPRSAEQQPPPFHISYSNSHLYSNNPGDAISFSGPHSQEQQLKCLLSSHEARNFQECPDCGITVRGPYELHRHRENVHAPVKHV
jgi:hypothetical protein